MHREYRVHNIKQLRDQQVRYLPRDKKIEQVDRAEEVLNEIEADRTYTYEYLCFRITQFRPDSQSQVALSGLDVLHDLRLFVEDVSDGANVRVETAGQAVHTIEGLAKIFKVSTKTISRWRHQGLVSRRFLFNGRKRVGFLESSVQRFVTSNRDRVIRGGQFSQLTDQERGEIIQRARRLARAGGCPSEVTRRVASHMSRSIETIRYTLKHFDKQHPDLAVFPDRFGPISEENKGNIYRQYRRGTSVDLLSKKHCRTKTGIYRIVNEMRAKRILELPLGYMASDEFKDADADSVILGPMPMSETPARKVRVPAGLPPYLASLYEVPLLNREQEVHLFRKFNYLKYKAEKLREKLKPAKATSEVMSAIERLYNRAVQVKNQIVQANLRLVVSIAKRHISPSDDFFTLVSDGNVSLIRAAEKFDYSRGNKFSTYASWAVMKNFARTIPGEFKHRDRFRTSHDEMFVATVDSRSDQYELESAQLLRESQVGRILSSLDEREQQIIISRFGLDHRQEPQTLKEVGAEMGVTKERIRQIEARALSKLRIAVKEERIDVPD